LTPEFPIDWKGFNASEKRKLTTRWARLSFPPELCAKISGQVSKGAPGQPGSIFVHANDLKTFTENFQVEVDFSGIDDLVAKPEDFAQRCEPNVQRRLGAQKGTQP
jgi:hypothetical protein